jgi:hypothetical protein
MELLSVWMNSAERLLLEELRLGRTRRDELEPSGSAREFGAE